MIEIMYVGKKTRKVSSQWVEIGATSNSVGINLFQITESCDVNHSNSETSL